LIRVTMRGEPHALLQAEEVAVRLRGLGSPSIIGLLARAGLPESSAA